MESGRSQASSKGGGGAAGSSLSSSSNPEAAASPAARGDADGAASASAATSTTVSWSRVLATSMNNIGAIHHSLGRRGLALRGYQRAVRARMDALREDAEAEGGGTGADASEQREAPRPMDVAAAGERNGAERAGASLPSPSPSLATPPTLGGDAEGGLREGVDRVGVGRLSVQYEEEATAALAEEERLRAEEGSGRALHGWRGGFAEGGVAESGSEAVSSSSVPLACEFLDLYLSGSSSVSEGEPIVVVKSEPIRIDHGKDNRNNGIAAESGSVNGESRNGAPSALRRNDNRDSAITLFNMALCHLQVGYYSKSSSLFDMAWSVIQPESDPGLAALILHGIAQLQYWGGMATEAMRTSAQVMRLLRSVLTDAPDEREGVETSSSSLSSVVDVERCVVSTLSLMGRIHYTDGEPAKALELCQEVLRLRCGSLGENHVDTLCTLYNIGLVLERCGRRNDAAKHCFQFVDGIARFLSSGNGGAVLPLPAGAQIGTALFTVGTMHLQNDLVTPAIRVLRQSLSVRTSVLGPHHVLLAETLFKLGEVLSEIGTYPEAMDHYRESVRIYRLHDDLDDAAAVLCGIGQVHHERGELDEALAIYDEVLRIAVVAYGQDDEFVAQMEGILGNIYLEKGETAEAMRRFASAARIMRRLQQREERGVQLAAPDEIMEEETPFGSGTSPPVIMPMVVQSSWICFYPCAAAA